MPALDHGDPRHDDPRGPLGEWEPAARPEADPGRGRRHDRVGAVPGRHPDVLEVRQAPPSAGPLLRDGRLPELPRHRRRSARRPLVCDARPRRDAGAPWRRLAVGRARRPVAARPAARAVARRVLLQDVHPAAMDVEGRRPVGPADGRARTPSGGSDRAEHVAASPLRRARGRSGRGGARRRRGGGRARRARRALRRGRRDGPTGRGGALGPSRRDRRVRRTDGLARVFTRARPGPPEARGGGDRQHGGASRVPGERPAGGDARPRGGGTRGTRREAGSAGRGRGGSRGGDRSPRGPPVCRRAHRRGRRAWIPRGPHPRGGQGVRRSGRAAGGRERARTVRGAPRCRRRDPRHRMRRVRHLDGALAARRAGSDVWSE
jgi:hypothetical protein